MIDVPLLLRDPLEDWLEPRLAGLASAKQRRLVEEVIDRAGIDERDVLAARPLVDVVTSLRILRRSWSDLDLPAGVAARASSLIGGRNSIAHLKSLSIEEVLSVLDDGVDLLDALGAAGAAEPLDRRRRMLRRQVGNFPFPGVAGQWRRRTLFVAPCSAHKRKFSERADVAPGPHDVLSELRSAGAMEAADALARERERVAERAGLNTGVCGLLPAYERYSEGTLWKGGREPRKALRGAVEDGAALCLVSGAYGVVHAREPIGYYDIELADAGWRGGVIERSLAEYASALGVERIVALLRVPEYQRIARDAPWRTPVRNVDILSPEGLQEPASSDASLGEALEVLLSDEAVIPQGWVSSDGAVLMREKVR